MKILRRVGLVLLVLVAMLALLLYALGSGRLGKGEEAGEVAETPIPAATLASRSAAQLAAARAVRRGGEFSPTGRCRAS